MAEITVGGTPGRHKLTPEKRDEIARRYASGENTLALAAEFGVTRRIPRILALQRGFIPRKHGIPYRLAMDEAAFAIITPESAYWIGFLMADGCVSDRGAVALRLAERDGAHVYKFREFLKSSHKIHHIPPQKYAKQNNGPAVHFSVMSKTMSKDLARFGILPRKSLTARVIGLESDRHFWRGVVDGDGSLSAWQNAKYTYPRLSLVGSEHVITQFATFVRSHYPSCNTSPFKPTGRNVWAFSVAGQTALALLHILYDDATIALDRKLTIAIDMFARVSINGRIS